MTGLAVALNLARTDLVVAVRKAAPQKVIRAVGCAVHSAVSFGVSAATEGGGS
jgi:hypothetical protein